MIRGLIDTEQMSIFDMMYDEYAIHNKIRLVELFSGYGSQAISLRNIGADFEHYKAIEIDPYAMKAYNAVHGTDFVPTDVKNVKGGDLEIADKDKYTYLLTYSFPCTDISNAGLQMGMAEGSGTRSSLLWEVKRILNELKETGSLPQILLMENVSAIHNEKNRPHYRKWIEFLESIGYKNYGQDLNTADYGLPQHRERCFLLSIHGNYNYRFPTPMELVNPVEYYYEDMSDEEGLKYILKSDKAKNLLVDLDNKEELEDDQKT